MVPTFSLLCFIKIEVHSFSLTSETNIALDSIYIKKRLQSKATQRNLHFADTFNLMQITAYQHLILVCSKHTPERGF